MDLSCIISSGDLELYVLGMLPEEEAYKITQLISLFPEIQKEVDAISASLASVAAGSAAAPSDEVRNKIFSQFSELKAKENPSGALFATRAASGNKAPVAKSPGSGRPNWLMAAAIAGLFITTGAVIFLSMQASKQKRELAELKNATERTKEELAGQKMQNVAYGQMLEMLQDENFSRITLSSVAGKPAASANVFWNRKTKAVYLGHSSLPQAPAGKQYQLWAIVDGKPVNAGLLSTENNPVQKMRPFQKADAFAITLEKAGGSEQPTLEQMYLLGKPS